MDLPTGYSEGLSSRIKSGRAKPRTARDEQVERFLDRLNDDRRRDGIKRPYSFPEVSRMLKGKEAPELYKLFQDLSGPGVMKFGGLLRSKLQTKV